MVKNIKKVLASLGLTILLTSSVGQAASFSGYNNYSNSNRYRVKYNYNYNYSNYNNNYYRNWFTQYTPVTTNNWEKIEKVEKVETPETPKESNTTKTETNTNVENKVEVNYNTGNTANSSVEMEVVNLVNIERQKAGLAPLQYSSELSNVARAKSQDMASKNYFSHNSPTYGDPFSMMKSFGIKYKTAGENIAKGYSSA
ncbi:MAG: serine protease, partial [Tissierellia bacterium]|nr:serine protease [Tissierellia bacterium]